MCRNFDAHKRHPPSASKANVRVFRGSETNTMPIEHCFNCVLFAVEYNENSIAAPSERPTSSGSPTGTDEEDEDNESKMPPQTLEELIEKSGNHFNILVVLFTCVVSCGLCIEFLLFCLCTYGSAN